MTTPQTQPPADIGEIVERLTYLLKEMNEIGVDDGQPIYSVAEKATLADLRALLTDRDDLVRKLGVLADALEPFSHMDVMEIRAEGRGHFAVVFRASEDRQPRFAHFSGAALAYEAGQP